MPLSEIGIAACMIYLSINFSLWLRCLLGVREGRLGGGEGDYGCGRRKW